MTERAQSGTDVVANGWRLALPAVVLALLAILALYRETAMTMVEIWSRSETFAHGFLVAPITLWLIWRIRSDVARLSPRPSALALVGVVAAGFFWLLGELATVGVLSQFALTTMVVLTVPAVLGLQVAWRIAFPLAFLYFSVPFGEFALPQLMEWTADYAILGLRLSGIPVYREGLHFVIPSGSWSVVEACSGVRYLIASLTVGTLFAYLNYHSLIRRLVFVGIAFIVPVIANWLRAYMIVMLGHFSGNALAVGVDHLIYGWVFFGVVIMIMFWVGSRWREDEFSSPVVLSAVASEQSTGEHSSSLLCALMLIVLAPIWPLAQWHIERSLPHEANQLETLGPIDNWPVVPDQLTGWTPRFENPSAKMQNTFGSDGQKVGLYIAYYRNQDYSRKMVSSANVLVSTNNLMWTQVARGTRQIVLNQQPIVVRSAELRSVDSSRMLVWQWYWVNGHVTASDYKAKAYTALSRLTGQGDDSAVIVAYALMDKTGGAETALEAFIHAAGPVIERALTRTREEK